MKIVIKLRMFFIILRMFFIILGKFLITMIWRIFSLDHIDSNGLPYNVLVLQNNELVSNNNEKLSQNDTVGYLIIKIVNVSHYFETNTTTYRIFFFL